MSFKAIETTLASTVANDGTLTLAYPSGFDKGAFLLGVRHRALYNGTSVLTQPNDFEISFGTRSAGITITNRSEASWLAGKTFVLQAETAGKAAYKDPDWGATKFLARAQRSKPILIDLGQPLALNTDQFIKAATSTELPNATTISYTPATNGTSPTDDTMVLDIDYVNGVLCWKMDVPRNFTVAATHGSSMVAMTIVARGYDVYGNAMRESLSITATGTSKSATGVKAFAAIYQIDFTAAGDSTTNTVNVGFGDVLGLPVFLPSSSMILAETVDGINVQPAGKVYIPFEIEQTELLAPTAEQIVCPVDGYISRLRGIIQGAVTTGGAITVEVNTVAVTGLTFTIADADAAGVRYNDAPTTPFSSTTVVAAGDQITVTPAAAINSAGQLNGMIEITTKGVEGTVVAGSVVEASATSADVRGTYTPRIACDGSQSFALLVALPDPGYLGGVQYNG